jgi:FixJ family two-component response regulator
LSKTPLIAIVDDDEAVRDALLDLLQVEGLSGIGYASAAAFLVDFACEGFDCLVTDVRMDGMDGLELQRRVRLAHPSMPVIFVTAAADDATRIRAMHEGATAYFTKPLANADLMTQLCRALRQRPGG